MQGNAGRIKRGSWRNWSERHCLVRCLGGADDQTDSVQSA